jgi:hypothetical protein
VEQERLSSYNTLQSGSVVANCPNKSAASR